jgi:hypothetical protein
MSSKKTRAMSQVHSDSDDDSDTFVNVDAARRFKDFIRAKSFHTERGFMCNMQEETLELPEEITRIITGMGWKKLAKHPLNYNAQMVKQFYSNLTDPNEKKKEVAERSKWVLYSEANIKKFYGIPDREDCYYAMLNTIPEDELTTIMESVTLEGTQWNYKNGVNEWCVKRMNLKPMNRVIYQFLKHFVLPTTHNETINKARLVLLHCVTAMQHINIGKIIAQEIANCSVKKEGMLYFLCLITGLGTKYLLPILEGDEIQKPINGFDKKSIDTLLKGNTRRKPRLSLLVSAPSTIATGFPEAVEKMDKMHKEMQIYWQWRNKFSLGMEAQFLYCFPGQTFAPLPMFPAELLPIEPEEEHAEEAMSDKPEPSKKAKKKRTKNGKKKKSSKKDKKPKKDKAALVTSEEQPKAVESNQ